MTLQCERKPCSSGRQGIRMPRGSIYCRSTKPRCCLVIWNLLHLAPEGSHLHYPVLAPASCVEWVLSIVGLGVGVLILCVMSMIVSHVYLSYTTFLHLVTGCCTVRAYGYCTTSAELRGSYRYTLPVPIPLMWINEIKKQIVSYVQYQYVR
jgi:hypothetical protein